MPKHPNRLASVATAVLLATISIPVGVWGQNKNESRKPEGQSTFKSRTELVLVPAVVLKGNKAVRGLTKDNFVLEQDGKARNLTVFEAIEPQTKRVAKKAVSEEFTNVGTDNTPRSMTLVVIDALNTPIGYQEQSRKDVLKYLARNVVPNQLVGVVIMGSKGIKIVHDFTANTDLLMKALQKASGESNRFNQLSEGTAPQPEVAAASNTQQSPFVQNTSPAESGGEPASDPGAQQLAVLTKQMQDFVKGVDQVQSYVTQASVQATLENFQQIAQGLSGYPGRKALIWASASFPTPFDPTRYNNMGIMNIYERTLKLLADANVAVYPVDIKGLQGVNPGADATLDPYQRAAGVDPGAAYRDTSRKVDSFRDFADRTGGKAYFDIGKVPEAFEDVAAESQTYYMLGYYLEAGEAQGWHKLKVKLKNADGHVRTRNGFFITPGASDPEVSRKDDLAIAARSPFDYTTLQLTGRFTGVSGTGPKKRVDFMIKVLPTNAVVDTANGNAMNLDFVAVARKFDTTVAGQSARNISSKLTAEAVKQIQGEGIAYKNFVELEPGDYEVRFLVRDNITGHMGTVLTPLTVK